MRRSIRGPRSAALEFQKRKEERTMQAKIMIEIAVAKDQERQLEHLAGVAASELGLLVQGHVKSPSRSVFVHPAGADEASNLVLLLSFDEVALDVPPDEAKDLEVKIEGGKTKSQKRCRARVLVARPERTT
jgi:hypothetical protein